MHRTTRLWAAMGLGLAMAFSMTACGGGDEAAPAEKPAAKPAPTPAPAPTPTPTPTPEPAPSPAAALEGDATAGAAVYANYCATCHGATGNGDGPLSASLPVQPAKHSDGAYMNGLTDEYLVRVISEGGPAVGKDAMMAPWGTTLSAQDIAHVVAYVRTLADPPYTP